MPLTALLAFCIFLRNNELRIGFVGPKYRPMVSKELKSERKQTGERGPSLSVRLLCEKNCLIFQTTSRVLFDRLFGSC